MRDVILSMSEINQVRLEAELSLAMRRPFRRIAIYSHHSKSKKFIDVSLKHFAAEDIRELMRAIHGQRPDLVLPKHWI
jgi:vacuolar-type H+-ATPase subunit C/Vma6